jgi:serine protease Do
VTVVGYPGAADTFESGILSEKSNYEASITDGKLSAKKHMTDSAPVLQISAPATHGNSGGPVLDDKASMIGLLTFGGDTVNGQEVSGFAFVVPSSTVLEFVRQAGAVNEYGATDELFHEGLELYWQGRYAPAIAKFEEVKRLFPRHSEVDRLIRQSQESLSSGAAAPEPVAVSLVLLGIVGVLFGGMLVAALVLAGAAWAWNRRRGPAPTPDPPAAPVAEASAEQRPGVVVPIPTLALPRRLPAETSRLGSTPGA